MARTVSTMDTGDDESARRTNPNVSLYRLNSNRSSSSIFEDVEMAHEEVRCLLLDLIPPSIMANPCCESSSQDQSQRVCQPVSQLSLTGARALIRLPASLIMKRSLSNLLQPMIMAPPFAQFPVMDMQDIVLVT